jgi:hypothetical protein
MRVFTESFKSKSIVLLFIFFTLNSFNQISCSNYVLCPDKISACANGQICCQKGSGYKCCPDVLKCCKDGTYCCSQNLLGLETGMISLDPFFKSDVTTLLSTAIEPEPELNLLFEEKIETNTKNLKCKEYLNETVITPIYDFLSIHKNTPSSSLVSILESNFAISEAITKLKDYCTDDILEVVNSVKNNIKELINIKNLFFEANRPDCTQELTKILSTLQNLFSE